MRISVLADRQNWNLLDSPLLNFGPRERVLLIDLKSNLFNRVRPHGKIHRDVLCIVHVSHAMGYNIVFLKHSGILSVSFIVEIKVFSDCLSFFFSVNASVLVRFFYTSESH